MIAAIYNCFDGLELLPHSMSNISPCVDGIIIVYQTTSNFGEVDKTVEEQVKYFSSITRNQVHLIKYSPDLGKQGFDNERMKREIGLNHAKKLGFTHFLDIDCDEFYHREEFLRESERVLSGNLNGLVCASKVYFKSPTLTIGNDVTFVPFLCKIEGATHKMNHNMPFAWSSMHGVPFTPKKQIRIDPTRQLSFTSSMEWSDIFMHHFSWVRKDYKKKIRNSSARANIERSTILNDLELAKDGYFCQFYQKKLVNSENIFGLPIWR